MQKIHEIIDEKFKEFAKNNHEIFSNLGYGEIVKITGSDKKIKGHDLCSLDMLEDPFNIAYFGKLEGIEGNFLIFINENMEKVYSYYDVE